MKSVFRFGPILAVVLAVTGINTVCTRERHSDAEPLLRMKAQCQEAGAKARRDWVQRYSSEIFSNEPEYGYSDRLQTCLYADSYSDSGTALLPGVNTREDRFVLDVYANKVILELTLHDGKVVPSGTDSIMCKSEEEFAARKARLFGPQVASR